MCSSISLRDFSTISSIRAGWIRPSWISFSNVIRAISRRIGSNPDSTTASGVSSIIRSIPVNVSNVRILRPSRPMIRPFISSFGNDTTDTVVSDTWSAAQRWIASDNKFFALRSASSFARCSDSFTIIVNSWFNSSSVDFMINSLASSLDKAAIRSNSCCCPSISFSTSFSRSSINCCFSLSLFSFSSSECSRFSKESSLRSSTCSLWSKRFSCDFKSSLLSFNSLSISDR